MYMYFDLMIIENKKSGFKQITSSVDKKPTTWELGNRGRKSYQYARSIYVEFENSSFGTKKHPPFLNDPQCDSENHPGVLFRVGH